MQSLQVARGRFIDNMSVLAVECCLIQKLRSIFTPGYVYGLEDEKVIRLAEERKGTSAERARVTEKLEIL